MKTVAIITAAGYGKRMGRPKQFIKIAGKTMLERTLAVFQKTKIIDGIILVVAKGQLNRARKLPRSKIIKILIGGRERYNSVRKGIRAVPKSAEVIVIHDGARPLVTSSLIERSVKEVKKYGAAIVGVPSRDTVKEISRLGPFIARTIERKRAWLAQTPQAFLSPLLRKAYSRVRKDVTDDAMLVEKLGIPVKMVMGSYQNIKITTPEDLLVARAIIEKGAREC